MSGKALALPKAVSNDVKAEFSASLLQSSVSHNPQEIISICRFAAQEILLSYVENSCGNLDPFNSIHFTIKYTLINYIS